MSTVYSNKILKVKDVNGDLTPDKDGAYTVVLGALGVSNNVGTYYADAKVTRDLINNSPKLHSLIERGMLFAEWGHPMPLPGQTPAQIDARMRRVELDRYCGLFIEVWTDEITHTDGKKYTAILGKVIPQGPYGPYLKEQLEQGLSGCSFSGRYWSTRKLVGGEIQLHIHTVATWDVVPEPGIEQAIKHNSPTMESASYEYDVTAEMLIESKQYEQRNSMGGTMESTSITADDIMAAGGLVKTAKSRMFGWGK